MKTGEGIPLHDHICEACEEFKPCLIGVRQVGSERPVEIFKCPDRLDRERAEYEARLSLAGV